MLSNVNLIECPVGHDLMVAGRIPGFTRRCTVEYERGGCSANLALAGNFLLFVSVIHPPYFSCVGRYILKVVCREHGRSMCPFWEKHKKNYFNIKQYLMVQLCLVQTISLFWGNYSIIF